MNGGTKRGGWTWLLLAGLGKIFGGENHPAGQARAQVYFSASRGMVLAAENLPELPPDRVYQVWAISGDSPVSAGTFQRERDGRGSLIALSQIPPPNAMAITVEPTGGVPLPTGPKYLQGLAE